jgi:hypothetical protein
MSWRSPQACITAPAPRKRQALKNAWVNTWKKPALKAPTPHARNMNPSWLTVEYASTFFSSFCTRRDGGREERRRAPTVAMTASTVGREHEDEREAAEQVDARGDHRGRVDERRDRRGARHRVREPHVERDLRALAACSR